MIFFKTFFSRSYRSFQASLRTVSFWPFLVACSLLLSLGFNLTTVDAAGPFAGGSGTVADPYQIANCSQFEAINAAEDYLRAAFVLTSDIDCASISPFIKIGTGPNYSTHTHNFFSGRFDGAGHTISNVTEGSSSSEYDGIFAYTFGASIRNVTLRNVAITGSTYFAGTLVGFAQGTSLVGITVSSSSVTVQNSAASVGGVVGSLQNGYAYAIVATSTTVTFGGSSQNTTTGFGGLIGVMDNSTLDRSYGSVTVTADTEGVGGLVGFMSRSSITNSYASSTVQGYTSVGGILGEYSFTGNTPVDDSYIRSSYSAGSTTATASNGPVGGILGGASGGGFLSDARLNISHSFAVGKVSSTTNSGGLAGTGFGAGALLNNYYYPTGTGQTRCAPTGSYSASECTTNNTSSYYNISTNAPLSSWNFANIWITRSGDRPTLRSYPFVEAASPTSIGTCAALASNIRTNPNGWFSLSADIDCAGNANYIPLNGTSSSYFVGTLDGNNHTISGVAQTIPDPYFSTTYDVIGYGLFSRIFGATIKNLTLAGGGITALGRHVWNIGGLAGYAHGVVMDSINSSVPIVGGSYYAGGLVGYGSGYFSNIHTTSTITSAELNWSTSYAGGIIGRGDYVNIANSTYSGNITAGTTVGGLLGGAGLADIDSSYSSGTITASEDSGGLVGYLGAQSQLISHLSHSSSSMAYVPYTAFEAQVYSHGGLIGGAQNTAVNSSSFSGTITFPSAINYATNIGGLIGGIGSNSSFPATSTVDSSFSNVYILAEGTGTPYFDRIGGLVGGSGDAIFTNVTASSTIRLGAEPLQNHIQSFSYVGGLVGYANGNTATGLSLYNTSVTGSITIREDMTSNNGYGYSLGGVAGFVYGGIFDSVTATVPISISSYEPGQIGGLVGDANYMTIRNVHSTSSLSIITTDSSADPYDIGGLLGFSRGNVIEQTAAAGTITVSAQYPYEIGGFAGWSRDDIISTSTSNVPITINNAVNANTLGGFVGGTYGSVFSNDLSMGSVSAINATGTRVSYVGGFAGDVGNAQITRSVSLSALGLMANQVGYVGGFLGSAHDSTIGVTFSSSTISISEGMDGSSFDSYVGGFLGYGGGGNSIANTYATTSISITSSSTASTAARSIGGYVGGLAVSATGDLIINSYSNGGVTLITNSTTPYIDVGGFAGSVADPTNSVLNSFTVSRIAPMASSTYVGAFVGEYNPSSVLLGNAYDTTRTLLTVCTGTDSVDPGWCTVRNVGGATPTYFYSALNAPQVGWDFSGSVWFEHADTYPTFVPGNFVPPVQTPPTVTTSSTASSITRTGAQVSGNLTALGSGTVTNEGFEFGPTTSYGTTITQVSGGFSTGVFSSTLSSLTCNTTYHFRSYASGADGTGYGTDQSFTTSACTVTPPSTPRSGTTPHDVLVIAPPAVSVPTPIATPPTTSAQPGRTDRPVLVQTPEPVVTAPPVVSTPSAPTHAPTAVVTERPSLLKLLTAAPLALLSLLAEATGYSLKTILETIGLLTGTVGIIWNFLSRLYMLRDISTLFSRGLQALIPFGYYRKKEKGWGTVYDSKTKRPLDPVVVTLYDAQGTEMKTAITDMDGRYGFLVPPGTYSITAEKGFHSFPARDVGAIDPVFPHPYLGGPITVGSEGVIVNDIPLDPTAFDWNEQEKYKHGMYKFFSRLDRPLAYLSLIFTPLGALITIYECIVEPDLLITLFMVFYVCIGFNYLAGLRPRLYGKLRTMTNELITLARVEAFNKGTDRMRTHAVSDLFGRYYLLLPKGDDFDIQVETRKDEKTFTPVYKSAFHAPHGYFNEDLYVAGGASGPGATL